MKTLLPRLIFSLFAATLNAQSPDLDGVKVSLEGYSGTATISAASLGKFKLRAQVNRNGDTQPMNVRVELPKTGRNVWPTNDVEVRDEAGTAMLVQRSGIEWENLLVPITEKVGAFIVQVVEPWFQRQEPLQRRIA
jgi:hypothetical protein